MSALDKIMTPPEAACFRATRRWHRVYLGKMLTKACLPHMPFKERLRKPRIFNNVTFALLSIFTSPLWLTYWLIALIITFLVYPLRILLSYTTPRGLRSPGERTIQGMHFQFTRYIELSPELYFSCLDDWVAILYGQSKLPANSIHAYMDTAYYLDRVPKSAHDTVIKGLLSSQLNSAREELSRDLGHY